MPEEDNDAAETERLKILELLEQHKITATEAAELLAALGDRGRDFKRRGGGRWLSDEIGPPANRARWFRVRVIRGIPGVEHVDDLFEAVRNGRRGMIFDVANEGGERVEIFID